MRLTLFAFLLASLPLQAAADGYEIVSDKKAFLRIVKDKELRIGLYNLTLKIMPNGRINGTALGWPITGTWSWKDGFFCREMDWSGTEIAANCQLVETKDNREIRFTVDRGTGKSATLRLR